MTIHAGTRRAQRGLTLIELLTSAGLTAVLLGLALPGFGELRERSQRAAINNELMATFSLARSEALRSRANTVVCPADAARSGCRADGIWQDGWLAFVDGDDDGQPNGPRDRLIAQGQLPSGTLLHSGTGRPRLRYAPNGLNRGSNLSVRVCLAGRVVSAIVVNNVGRSRVELDPAALSRWTCPEL